MLIDPNVAADGVTVADLKEQFEHNLRMRQLVTDASQLAARVRDAQAEAARRRVRRRQDEQARQVDAIAAKLFTEPVRYGKPGLQAHITYLAGMTTGADQKIGRDALERYATLRKDLDALARRARPDRRGESALAGAYYRDRRDQPFLAVDIWFADTQEPIDIQLFGDVSGITIRMSRETCSARMSW